MAVYSGLIVLSTQSIILFEMCGINNRCVCVCVCYLLSPALTEVTDSFA